jgi:predicted TIM-barrel fold metal-dependent hydrolase
MFNRARSAAMLAAFRVARSADCPLVSVPEHLVSRPRFPAIDAHDHLRGPFSAGWGKRSVADLERLLDAAGAERIVDLNGATGRLLDQEIERFRSLGDRVAVFAEVDYGQIAASDRFGLAMAADLRRSKDAGARGLKIWKTLGLRARDRRGRLVAIDDERLDPLWETAAEVELPITIHVADPRAFFEPLTRSNERWEELRLHPEWHYWPPRPRGRIDHPGYPAYDELIEQFRAVLRRHPRTTFIGAHVAGSAEDLRLVASMLDEHQNLVIDIGGRIAELGRQPYSAHDFMVRFADRVLFGSDHADGRAYALYYRLLETRDEYFHYGFSRAPQNGRWRIYGLGLPDPVLEQVYNLNAKRVIWGSR